MLVFYLLLFCIANSAFGQSYTTTTLYGEVEGFSDGKTINYLGIPFAAPPIESLRWKAPQPVSAWTTTYNATFYRPRCLQGLKRLKSEDCLYLNIYTPLTATATSSLPVIVFIHGGSFVSGSGSDYVGEFLTTYGGVILVTINYRLSIFGFLTLDSELNANKSSGNYGIQDQRAALKWVKENIQNFGGNSSQITVAGESAGAISICYHLASLESIGLFERALMQSGFCNMWELSQSKDKASGILKKLECNTGDPEAQAECVRSKNSSDLLLAAEGDWYPTVDGIDLIRQPLDQIKSGIYNKVPLLIGTNFNEFSAFLCEREASITALTYPFTVYSSFGTEVGERLLKLYPLSNYKKPIDALIALSSDYVFKCPTRELARAVSKSGSSTYLYSFNYIPHYSDECQGASHSFEIPLLFNYANYPPNSTEVSLSQTMVKYWTDFAKGAEPWKEYSLAEDNNIILDLPTFSYQTGYRRTECNFFLTNSTEAAMTDYTTPTDSDTIVDETDSSSSNIVGHISVFALSALALGCL